MKRSKRGQAATEFLMTYGWAIVVILLAFASLWVFGVFEKETPTKCSTGLPFGCPQAIIGENSVVLRIEAGEFATAEVTEFRVNDQICREIIGDLSAHSESKIICNGISVQEGEVAVAEFKLTYTKVGSTLAHDVPSRVTGEVIKIPTNCQDIKGDSGPYLIDPDGSGPVQPVETYCDMTTEGGGWTLCGKYDRDNSEVSNVDRTTLDIGWGRSFINEQNMNSIPAFTGKSASIDCRALINNGAEYILNAGSDDGEPSWDLVSILNIVPEIQADPTNLWDAQYDDPADGSWTCDPTKRIDTFDESLKPVSNQFGCGVSNRYYVQDDNNAFFATRDRPGASFSNMAGGADSCTGTGSDTVHWCWPDGQDGSGCNYGCCTINIGTGCHSNIQDYPTYQPTHRYNLMFMR